MPIEFLIYITIFFFCAAIWDLRYLKIPNKLVFLGLICYLILTIIMVGFNKIQSLFLLENTVTGILIVSIIFLTPYICGKIYRKQLLGAGDVKLVYLLAACTDVEEFLVFTGFLILFASVGYIVKYKFNKIAFRRAGAFVPYMFLSVLSTLILRILEVI